MTPELRAELDRIEEFLMGPQGADLAMVLSALRGPDETNEIVKESTTNFIRNAAFPRLHAIAAASSGGCNARECWMMIVDSRGLALNHSTLILRAKELILDAVVKEHFLDHVRRAALVLGLVNVLGLVKD